MNISPALTRAASRGLVTLQKHSPIIYTVVGVVGLVAAGVIASRQTLKLEETLDENATNVRYAKEQVTELGASEVVVTKAVVKSAANVAKLYWLPTTLAVGSTVLILAGQHIMHQRNAALVVAYKGLETAFNQYRQRVVEKYGEEIDKDFRYGVKEEVVVDENGKKQKTQVVDRGDNDYLFVFDESNENFVGQHEHNLFFLTGHQNMVNDQLRARGHVFLSEVLDQLGIPRTPASIVTGWVYDPNQELGGGRDNYIEFGIRDLREPGGRITLDFNVDGVIYDLI